MKAGGGTFAHVTGISAGIINLLIGLSALFGALTIQSYIGDAHSMAVAFGLLILTAVNFAGGCACRSHRIPGGVMMLVTALPMLATGVIALCLALLQPIVPARVTGAASGEPLMRVMMGTGILLLFVELASGAAAVVSLARREKPEYPPYAPHSEVDETVLSFAQKYAARRQSSGKAEDV